MTNTDVIGCVIVMACLYGLFCLMHWLMSSQIPSPQPLTVHFRAAEIDLIAPDGTLLESAKTPEKMFEFIAAPKYRKMFSSNTITYRGDPRFIGSDSEDNRYVELAAKLASLGFTGGKFEYVNQP